LVGVAVGLCGLFVGAIGFLVGAEVGFCGCLVGLDETLSGRKLTFADGFAVEFWNGATVGKPAALVLGLGFDVAFAVGVDVATVVTPDVGLFVGGREAGFALAIGVCVGIPVTTSFICGPGVGTDVVFVVALGDGVGIPVAISFFCGPGVGSDVLLVGAQEIVGLGLGLVAAPDEPTRRYRRINTTAVGFDIG